MTTTNPQEAREAYARLLQAAKVYSFNYMQDEAEDAEHCVCGPKQQAEAREVFDAIAAVEALAAQPQAGAAVPSSDLVTLDSAYAAILHVSQNNGPGRELEARAMLVKADTGASGAGEVKPWQAVDTSRGNHSICRQIEADLRAQLARQHQDSKPTDLSKRLREYTPGNWFDARTLDEMQAFYMSRLPAIREAAKEHGYAIGLHGSARRDFDLMAMQWRESASDKDTLAHAIAVAACGITRDGAYQWERKPSGRFAVSLPICWTDHANPEFGDKPSLGHIDLSVIATPAPTDTGAAGAGEVKPWQERYAEARAKGTGPKVPMSLTEECKDAEIADLRTQLARQHQDSKPTDLSKRLRKVYDDTLAFDSKLLIAAADEIERLAAAQGEPVAGKDGAA